MILVSACLVGVSSRYDGSHAYNADFITKLGREPFIPVCPELLGGLPIPRLRARILGGGGWEVLAGKASVRDAQGNDVTRAFLEGAQRTVDTALKFGVRTCFLKARSPSCACAARAPDRPIGVAAALLMANGFRVREV